MSYTFVDGGYFTKRLEEFARNFTGGDKIELDHKAYFTGEKISYYDALPEQKRDEAEVVYAARLKVAEDHHARLRALPGCHVFNGKTVESGKRVQQKGVDVLLATHMLTHVFRKNAKRVTLLAGDGDFAPLVRALVMEGAYVTVQYGRASYSSDLLEAADVSIAIKAQEVLEKTTEAFKAKHPPANIYNAQQASDHGMKLVRKGTTTVE